MSSRQSFVDQRWTLSIIHAGLDEWKMKTIGDSSSRVIFTCHRILSEKWTNTEQWVTSIYKQMLVRWTNPTTNLLSRQNCRHGYVGKKLICARNFSFEATIESITTLNCIPSSSDTTQLQWNGPSYCRTVIVKVLLSKHKAQYCDDMAVLRIYFNRVTTCICAAILTAL